MKKEARRPVWTPARGCPADSVGKDVVCFLVGIDGRLPLRVRARDQDVVGVAEVARNVVVRARTEDREHRRSAGKEAGTFRLVTASWAVPLKVKLWAFHRLHLRKPKSTVAWYVPPSMVTFPPQVRGVAFRPLAPTLTVPPWMYTSPPLMAPPPVRLKSGWRRSCAGRYRPVTRGR